jgi:hypothetical protein
MRFPPENILPSAEGGVGICFRALHRYADIECFNCGEIWTARSEGGGDPRVEEVQPTEADVRRALHEIREFLQS